MLLTSSCEIACFAIGTLSTMPAVNTFAIYATVAVFFDLLFQITAFVALLAVDESRYRVSVSENFTSCYFTVSLAQKIGCSLLHQSFQIGRSRHSRLAL